MNYIKVKWLHDLMDEPIYLFSEIDKERNEVRKIEVFKSGKISHAPDGNGIARLSVESLPSNDEINGNADFILIVIDKAKFEKIWNNAINT